MTDQSGQRRVVIVGGGFAGLFAVRALRRSASVTLIDRAQHHVLQPLLYQSATGILSEGKIAEPLRDLLKKHKNVDCVMAEVCDLHVVGRRVTARRIGGELGLLVLLAVAAGQLRLAVRGQVPGDAS